MKPDCVLGLATGGTPVAVSYTHLDFDQIESAVQAFHAETEKPTCIILDAVKGTGVSYMTNSVAWHG